jgi:hypothetical protein
VFDGTVWDRLKYQFDCPFHLQRLPQPTTLYTLLQHSDRMAHLVRLGNQPSADPARAANHQDAHAPSLFICRRRGPRQRRSRARQRPRE